LCSILGSQIGPAAAAKIANMPGVRELILKAACLSESDPRLYADEAIPEDEHLLIGVGVETGREPKTVIGRKPEVLKELVGY
jgi:hypothetical protein